MIWLYKENHRSSVPSKVSIIEQTIFSKLYFWSSLTPDLKINRVIYFLWGTSIQSLMSSKGFMRHWAGYLLSTNWQTDWKVQTNIPPLFQRGHKNKLKVEKLNPWKINHPDLKNYKWNFKNSLTQDAIQIFLMRSYFNFT